MIKKHQNLEDEHYFLFMSIIRLIFKQWPEMNKTETKRGNQWPMTVYGLGFSVSPSQNQSPISHSSSPSILRWIIARHHVQLLHHQRSPLSRHLAGHLQQSSPPSLNFEVASAIHLRRNRHLRYRLWISFLCRTRCDGRELVSPLPEPHRIPSSTLSNVRPSSVSAIIRVSKENQGCFSQCSRQSPYLSFCDAISCFFSFWNHGWNDWS